MTQTDMAAGVPGRARFCSSCGGALPVATARCPRCGAVITAQGKAKSSHSAMVVVVVAVALLGALPCIGILAAIAIPNFIRYQLRAKEASVKADLGALVKSEKEAALSGGRYLALGPLPAGTPGVRKLPLSAADLQVASGIDWMVEPSTYGQFRVAVADDDAGRQAAALCAESDLDGDGTRAVYVAFLPFPGGAPPATCTTPIEYDARYEPEQVVKISESSVF